MESTRNLWQTRPHTKQEPPCNMAKQLLLLGNSGEDCPAGARLAPPERAGRGAVPVAPQAGQEMAVMTMDSTMNAPALILVASASLPS